MITDAGENIKTKNNAQALVLKKIIKGKERTEKQKIDLGKITKHFESHFTNPEAEELAKGLTSFFGLVNESEVREAAKKPSNSKTPGPDEVTSEDLKTSDQKTVRKTLNEMLRERDGKHTNGYMVLLLKPGKDRTEPVSYRPVNLLSTYRKLSSLIILERINPKIEASILTSQNAYGNWKSTGDIMLAHKNLLAGSSTKRTPKVCAGIDMSKAFDTVDRKELIDILRKRGIEEENVTIIKPILNQTTLRAKIVKR